jgi:Ser/Thr protein kinase RdoA (MazF antagonist)
MTKPYSELDGPGQVRRLRGLARRALDAYGLGGAQLRLLAHSENTTFRVTTADGAVRMLRINRPDRHSQAQIRSELDWLAALRRSTELYVPGPLPAQDGDLLVVAEAPGVPQPRVCVLFRWVEGRFQREGATPRQLEQVGALVAGLHLHAAKFVPPPGFERVRVDQISDVVRADKAGLTGASIAHALGLVGELLGPEHVAPVEAALGRVRAVQAQLGRGPEVFGLIHADLHRNNVLFKGGRARAIDFDDCGYGHFLYDLAVVLGSFVRHTHASELRAALLRGYRSLHPLPRNYEELLPAFFDLRRVQVAMWSLELREHPAFRERWRNDALRLIGGLTVRG